MWDRRVQGAGGVEETTERRVEQLGPGRGGGIQTPGGGGGRRWVGGHQAAQETTKLSSDCFLEGVQARRLRELPRHLGRGRLRPPDHWAHGLTISLVPGGDTQPKEALPTRGGRLREPLPHGAPGPLALHLGTPGSRILSSRS